SWLEGLAIGWLIVVVLVTTLVVTVGIYFGVMRAAANERRGAAFRAVSPGMLPPMGLVFGLIVGFLVAGLWNDLSDARDAVNREASSLRSAELVTAATFPGQAPRMDALIRRHIHEAATKEWPAMADQRATL